MNARILGSFLCVLGLPFAVPVSAGDDQRKSEKKTFKAADGLPTFAELSGHGDTALVFLHGWCGDHEYWKYQVGPFSADYRVIALDLAGHSQSGKDRKEWTVAGLADDVAGVVKELGLKRVVLIGHSMGGPVALMTAKRLPGVAVAVVGVDTLQNADFKMPKEAVDGLIKQFEDDFKKAVGEGFMSAMFAESSNQEAKKLVCTKAESQDQKMALALMRNMWTLDQAKLLKEAGVPVRCINSGGGYRFHAPTNVDGNKKYADFDAILIDDVGHYPMLEKPDDFNKALKKTLAELPKKP